jgi:hypothetical protein
MPEWAARLTFRQKVAAFKKAAQNFWLIWACGVETSTAQFNTVFFASFCSQKEAFPFA